ncbi:MAG: InlB B-repeat-containing protein [Bacilli bacterium]|nr:InlB B-repeat-containing protein [Bacilli bacterium]
MKNKKYLILAIALVLILFGSVLQLSNTNNLKKKKIVNIEEVLLSPNYSYLPEPAKDYIREHYKETGEVLLTEKNKEEDKSYLNPQYIEYLVKGDKSSIAPNPTVVDYNSKIAASIKNDTLPASYDLRNVDGKNYVTPFKDQGDEGLCWDYGTNAHMESNILVQKKENYNSNSIILSEQQIAYAAGVGTLYGRQANNTYQCNDFGFAGDGGGFNCSTEVMLDGLGVVSKDWDEEHSEEISHDENNPKQRIAAADIYNFDNSLYEVNSTLEFPVLDFESASDDVKKSYINEIKRNVMDHGGAYIGVQEIGYTTFQDYHGDMYPVLSYPEGGIYYYGSHAMQIIGWDDDFEYIVCTNTLGAPEVSDCPNASDRVSGKGVWIVKNSWGEENIWRIILVGYESIGNEINFVTDFQEKNWDNFYQLDREYINETTSTYTFKDSSYVSNEELNKIKVYLFQNANYKIYIDVAGNSNYVLLDEITSTYPGNYMLDLSTSNYNISEKTVFKVVSESEIQDFRVYTNNNSNDIKIKTFDAVYDSSNATFNNTKYFDINIYSNTKNLDNYEELTFKIKDSNGTYINPSGYEYEYNEVYANMSDVKLTINSDYFSKGEYTIETYYNNTLYSTSSLNIEIDLTIINGDGSFENPWQISTPSQFDLIRNNPYDSYILMNDIDFEYDTQNENGLFYNDGFGFPAIEEFYGYLNGNGHSIKNLYSKSEIDDGSEEVRIGGIFDRVYISPYDCNFNKCGITNIKIINSSIIGAYDTGGLANALIISDSEIFKFDNISVIGGRVTNLSFPSHKIGGIVGEFTTSETDLENKITISNLYNSSNVVSSNDDSRFDELIGGVFAKFSPKSSHASFPNNIEFNNVMNTGKVESGALTALAANLFNLGYADNANIAVNNAISVHNPNVKDINSSSSISTITNCNVAMKNIYTNATSVIGSDITNTKNNVKNNLTVYEIANENYSDWSNFDSNWYQNKANGVNRIPVIKNVSYDYLDIETEVVLRDGETINVSDLINSSNKNINVLTSCNYNVAACNNTTDTSIVSVNGTNITALKDGNTSVIVTSENDGYIGLINIYVGDYVKVTYYSNDGNDVNYRQGIEKNTDTPLDSNRFTRTGYKFISWNTKADGSGTEYTNNQSVNLSEDLELYAQWGTNEYNIEFNANSGTGTMDSIKAFYNKEYTLSSNSFKKEHYFFIGWNTKSDGSGTTYKDKAKVKNLTSTDGDTVTLYAIWKAADGIINFHANDDSDKINTQEFIFDTDFNLKDNDFSKEGYEFVEWNTEEDGSGDSYNNKQLMHINHEDSYMTIDLYAIWDEEYDFIINKYLSDRTDMIIDLIEHNTTIDEFKSNIILNPNYSVEVEYKEVDGNKCVYTGGKTKIYKNNEDYMELVNIVRGDVNGSGDVDIIDYLKIKKEIMNKEKLDGVYKTAADFSKNGKIDEADYTKVRNIIMGDE